MTKEQQLIKASYTVLLPAFADLSISESLKTYLKNGGCSILIGETRSEYVNREMSLERKQGESSETIKNFVDEVRILQPNLIVAIDQEIVGIRRLHNLVSSFTNKDTIMEIDSKSFEAHCEEIGNQAKSMGVNCFLAPILDIVKGKNPWLKGRTWTTNVSELINISTGYINGIQRSKVITTAKHFPGFGNIELDPAIEKNAIMDASIQDIEENYLPFKSAAENNVEMMMVGPAIVKKIDPINPAGLSRKVIKILREEIGFRGIILSDDLDAKATLLDNTIEETAIKALQAGLNFLLLADIENQLIRVAEKIQSVMKEDDYFCNHVIESAERIQSLASRYSE